MTLKPKPPLTWTDVAEAASYALLAIAALVAGVVLGVLEVIR